MENRRLSCCEQLIPYYTYIASLPKGITHPPGLLCQQPSKSRILLYSKRTLPLQEKMQVTMASMNPHSGIGQSDSMQRMVSLRVSLAYTEMTMGANGSVMSRAEKLELRARNGFCKECEGIPVQLFTIKKSRLNPLWVTREPLNVTGECENGVCFVCHPDKDPSRKHKMLYGIRRRREGGHYSAPDHSMSPSPRLLYSSKGANAALQRATIQIGDQPFGSNGYPPITMQTGT